MSLLQQTGKRKASLAILLLVGLGVSGCLTSNEDELARLLRDLDKIGHSSVAGAAGAVTGRVATVAAEPVKSRAPAATLVPATNPTPAAAGASVQNVGPMVPAAGARAGVGVLTIQPNCIVQISVDEDPGLNGSYPVNDIGAADIGYIGPVILHNKTEKEAAEKISEVLLNRGEFKATVKVRIVKASYGKVKIAGAVRQPGMIKVGAGDSISLNDALLQAGGLLPNAWGGMVRVYRGGLLSAVPEAGRYEEYSLQTDAGQPRMPAVALRNTDVASIIPPMSTATVEARSQPPGDKELLVLGEVGRPGFYRFGAAERCTMMHLLFRLNLPKFANTRAIRVVRRDESGWESEIIVDGEKILETGRPEDDVPLENGDRIIVPERKFTIW
jgi:protein involved in polysaccharide export with SLBB domain